MARTSCLICDELAGRLPTPGGVIFSDGLWTVTHHRSAYTDPGDLIIQTQRHCESLADVSPEEAAALGPILRSAVRVVERVIVPERVYVASYSERVLHVHFFVLPRTAALPKGHIWSDVYRRGRNFLRQWGVLANPSQESRVRTAERMRAEWQA
jgi:diadenosine tetraphosphate (Ap4A) HIT family hydrolase